MRARWIRRLDRLMGVDIYRGTKIKTFNTEGARRFSQRIMEGELYIYDRLYIRLIYVNMLGWL